MRKCHGTLSNHQHHEARKTGKNCYCRRTSTNKKLGKEVIFRADAALAKPEIYEALEERGEKYAKASGAHWRAMGESEQQYAVEGLA
jgi:hypothetical protein